MLKAKVKIKQQFNNYLGTRITTVGKFVAFCVGGFQLNSQLWSQKLVLTSFLPG